MENSLPPEMGKAKGGQGGVHFWFDLETRCLGQGDTPGPVKGRGRLQARGSENPGGRAVFLEYPGNRQRTEPDGHPHRGPRGEPRCGSQRRRRQSLQSPWRRFAGSQGPCAARAGAEPKRTGGVYTSGLSGASGLGEEAGAAGEQGKGRPGPQGAGGARQPSRSGRRGRGCRPPSGMAAPSRSSPSAERATRPKPKC